MGSEETIVTLGDDKNYVRDHWIYKKQTPDGIFHYNNQGQLHCKDGPAIIRVDGTKEWYFNGQRHRIGEPAFEGSNGAKSWWLFDKLHRINGPAYEGFSGYKEWWFDGVLYHIRYESGLITDFAPNSPFRKNTLC